MLLMLVCALAAAGSTLRVTVEVGPDGPVLRDAVHGGASLPRTSPPGRPLQALEVLDAEGAPLARLPVPDARHRTLLTPDGGEVGVLDQAIFTLELPWPEGAARVGLAGRQLIPRTPLHRSGHPDLVPIQASGPASDRLDLVLLGDGYSEGQLDDFAADVDWIVDYLLTIQPWSHYTGMLNIWRIDRPSADSGISHPDHPRTTAYGCAYGCAGLDRLVCCDDDAVLSTVQAALPGADGILVLLNDQAYGGSGGFNYAASFVGPEGRQVAAHELGHTLVGLWDEYGYGYDGGGHGPNCSADSGGTWDDWLGTEGVGAWPECSFTNLHRPTDRGCMMRTLRNHYCPVCREQAVLAMYRHLPRLILATDPPPGPELLDAREAPVTLRATTVGPDQGLTHTWTVDGEVVGTEPQLPLRCSGIEGEVFLEVRDDTPWVRSDPDLLLVDTAGPWTVTSERCLPEEVLACSDGCATGGRGAGLFWVAGAALALLRRRDAKGRV